MADDIISNLYNKYIKKWFKNNYKFLITILAYILYQGNFLITLLYNFGIKLISFQRPIRMGILTINDLIYVVFVLLLFKNELKEGLKDLKKNLTDKILLSVNCWLVGCLVMTLSSVLISLISGKDLSTNESLVRQSIALAPLYMLFTCTVVAPVLEEMVFRRSLQGIIKNKWVFILVSGIGFGLLHVLGNLKSPIDLLYIVPYGSMGCAFAFLLTKTENITLPIIIHMIHNLILVVSQILR